MVCNIVTKEKQTDILGPMEEATVIWCGADAGPC